MPKTKSKALAALAVSFLTTAAAFFPGVAEALHSAGGAEALVAAGALVASFARDLFHSQDS